MDFMDEARKMAAQFEATKNADPEKLQEHGLRKADPELTQEELTELVNEMVVRLAKLRGSQLALAAGTIYCSAAFELAMRMHKRQEFLNAQDDPTLKGDPRKTATTSLMAFIEQTNSMVDSLINQVLSPFVYLTDPDPEGCQCDKCVAAREKVKKQADMPWKMPNGETKH